VVGQEDREMKALLATVAIALPIPGQGQTNDSHEYLKISVGFSGTYIEGDIAGTRFNSSLWIDSRLTGGDSDPDPARGRYLTRRDANGGFVGQLRDSAWDSKDLVEIVDGSAAGADSFRVRDWDVRRSDGLYFALDLSVESRDIVSGDGLQQNFRILPKESHSKVAAFYESFADGVRERVAFALNSLRVKTLVCRQ
jgi:hypothetical protein